MLQNISMALVASLAVLLLIIVFQNRENVETKFLFATVTMPHAALLFITLAIGCAIGALATWSFTARAKKRRETS